jgi:hypothetical protein
MKALGIVLAVGLAAWACDAQAGIRHCDHCGCRRNCKKYCRLVCGTKTETKTEYSCESEDFCVPGPSERCGVKSEFDCEGHKHRTTIWKPACAEVRTRTNLVKKEIKKEVPDYKWIVEEICPGCGHCVSRTERSTGSSLASIDDHTEGTESAIDGSPDDADFALAGDHQAVAPAADEANPVRRKKPNTQPRGRSRFLQVLLRAKGWSYLPASPAAAWRPFDKIAVPAASQTRN